jgi:PPM family protein phosphatase
MSPRRVPVHAVASVPGNSGRPSGAAGLEIEFAQVSDPGKKRGHNEDCLGSVLAETPERAQTHGWLFAVADGLGGHEKGEVASSIAIEAVTSGFRSAVAGEPYPSLLQRLVQAANIQVYEAGRAASPGGVSMGTTIVACALRFDRAAIAHVGDSRCYLIRQGRATLLTRDHTVVNDQIRIGVLSAREAAQSEARHLLSRSLGNDLFVGVETSDHQIFAGDIFLLCSDGFHGSIETAELGKLLTQTPDLHQTAANLVALANERDGGDNISVQLIRVRGVERVGMYRGRPYRLR